MWSLIIGQVLLEWPVDSTATLEACILVKFDEGESHRMYEGS